MIRLLTIAGSDSSGGAGIQRDLRVFHDHHCHGLSAITAVTAQHTHGVIRVDVVPPEGLRAQLEAVRQDGHLDGVKTGMLVSAAHIDVVVDFVSSVRVPVVVDPVMVSSSGRQLLDDPGALDRLLDHATVGTPNVAEAALLTTSTPLLVTGGDTDTDEVIDRLGEREWRNPRLPGRMHGSGCTLSSALLVQLARGIPLTDAVPAATAYVRTVWRSD